MGWFSINRIIIICLLLIFAGCGKEETYTKQNIETRPATGIKIKNEPGIGLTYKVKKDTQIYTDPDKETAFDSIEKGTLVEVKQEAENGFVYVNYQGQGFYVEVEDLEGI